MKRRLKSIYSKLYVSFGPQHWWPADSPFEVMVGAILTQNTCWSNVERAITNLKKYDLLYPRKLYKTPHRKLSRLIRPAGYYNLKTRRLKEFLKFFINNYGASIKKIQAVKTKSLRDELLSIKGVGPETADSILLYALGKAVFVVDAYTKRVFLRHKLLKDDVTYGEAQGLFSDNLKKEVNLFKEYHALIVALAKRYCLKSNPKCSICCLKDDLHP